MDLLNENEVVDAVAAHLASSGYTIEQKLHGHQRGVDIIARSHADPARLVYVEAKGGTSSRIGSANYGKAMTGGEVRINVAEAFYTAAIASTAHGASGESVLSAIAVHDDARHRKYVVPLLPVLQRLRVGVFWVTYPDLVALDAPWSLA